MSVCQLCIHSKTRGIIIALAINSKTAVLASTFRKIGLNRLIATIAIKVDTKDYQISHELPWINGHLCALLLYHIQTMLGFDKDAIRKKTVETGAINDDNHEIFSTTNWIKRK